MQDIVSSLISEAFALNWVDWLATVTAILYVWLAAKNNPWCWGWGIISCSLWAYASFFYYQLWLDALLQVFYVAMAFWGWYQWRLGNPDKAAKKISRLPIWWHAPMLVLGAVLSLIFGYYFAAYTSAAATYWDALTTVFSVIATFLLVQRVLENWLYWIVTDALYIWLYASREAWLFSLLMVVYTLIAVWAFFNWRREIV
ncbi:MAG TPA: nicotinamide riboside transporter PnuC [Saprospiraceae bacterium]|nr:nicotinamide riboside transporter PnuC [Saprospiraceae bacterium]